MVCHSGSTKVVWCGQEESALYATYIRWNGCLRIGKLPGRDRRRAVWGG